MVPLCLPLLRYITVSILSYTFFKSFLLFFHTQFILGFWVSLFFYTLKLHKWSISPFVINKIKNFESNGRYISTCNLLKLALSKLILKICRVENNDHTINSIKNLILKKKHIFFWNQLPNLFLSKKNKEKYQINYMEASEEEKVNSENHWGDWMIA